MDLSTGFSVNSLTRNHAEAMDLVKKPEWYRRHTPTCSADTSAPLRTRSRMDKPEVGLGGPLCPKMEDAVCYDDTMDRRSATLPPQALGLYHESVRDRLWQAGFYHQPDLMENAAATADSSTGTDSDSGSDVIFLLSASKDSPACSSVSRESASPAAVVLSLDGEGRGCFLLPSALSSPSGESSCSSDSSDGSSVIPVHHARPVVLLSDVKIDYRKFAESPINISSDDDDDSAVVEVSVTADKRRPCVFADSSSDKESASDKRSVRNERGDLRRSPRIKTAVAAAAPVAAEFNCKATRRSLRSQMMKCGYEDADDSEEVMDYIQAVSSSSSEEEEEKEEEAAIPSRPKVQRKKRRTSCSSDDSSDNSSNSDSWQPSKIAVREAPRAERARRKPTPQIPKDTKTVSRNARLKTSQKPAKPLPAPKPAPAATRKAAQKKPAAGKRRRKRKRRPSSPPPLFPPGEPDILLKYTKLREERKKKSRSDDFQAYVHVGKRTCTVVNYQEDEGSAGRPRCDAADPASHTGSLPNTSCYRLGRLGSQSGGQPPQTCCLCGRSANAMSLGDLHGPYYPMPQFPQGRVPQRGRHSPLPNGVEIPAHSGGGHGSRPVAESNRVHGNDDEEEVKVEDEEEEDGGGGDVEDDRSSSVMVIDSPRVLAESTPRTEELWVHEDCGVWSTGVFLVKGRLYGLKEASEVAKDVVCCGCHESGAIMGCFQKGCMLNYHYRCAISSGCLLNEENFSMKCSQHKNKVFTSATRRHHKR
ncbi:unnamed protein product [Merluccius merluccius]